MEHCTVLQTAAPSILCVLPLALLSHGKNRTTTPLPAWPEHSFQLHGLGHSVDGFPRKYPLTFPAAAWCALNSAGQHAQQVHTELREVRQPDCCLRYGKRLLLFQPGLHKYSGDRSGHSSGLKEPFAELLQSLSWLKKLLSDRCYQGTASQSIRIISFMTEAIRQC